MHLRFFAVSFLGALLIGSSYLTTQVFTHAPALHQIFSVQGGAGFRSRGAQSVRRDTPAARPGSFTFSDPIDALSIGVSGWAVDLEVSARIDGRWTEWQRLELEAEFDPLMRESNLVVFPTAISVIRIRGLRAGYELHPIRIAKDPVRYELAAATFPGRPRILTRRQWGADESFLITGPQVARSDEQPVHADNGSAEIPERVANCEEAQRTSPEDFRTSRTVTSDNLGRPLRWPQRYSPKVKLLVVHHTALEVSGDHRPPVERVRALYAYHANNRGWGDIGYHYLIDEEGQIYEGRAGGDYIVGGHVYCGNVGTIGIALLGNFDIEEPTQVQMQSLKWLLAELADRYNIRLDGTVSYHGERFPTVIGHKDLVTTDCPGYFVAETLGQLRSHLIAGKINDRVTFPRLARRPYVDRTGQRRQLRLASRGGGTEGFPRRVRKQLRLITSAGVRERRGMDSGVPTPARHTQMQEGRLIRIRLGYEGDAAALETTAMPHINDLSVSGRTVRLRRTDSACETAERPFPPPPHNDITLYRDNGGEREEEQSGVIRIDPGRGLTTIGSWDTDFNVFRGIIECRAIDGRLVLINELPLEDYLKGLAEEPDTEPFEKQRAFAVAARSYAAHYMQDGNRKFPGMPYDGDDTAAHFQSYGGAAFEQRNPQWVRAVVSTEGQVLMKDGDVLKAAYFTSSDGRTRSPAENGWTDFPHAEVFASKPDSWCRGLGLQGHGVGMSGCGASGQAREGKTGEEILEYYYPGSRITP